MESNQCLTAIFPLSTRSLMPMMKSHQCLRNTGNKKTSSWDGRLQAESKLLPSCSVLKTHQQLLVGSVVLASWLSACVCVCVCVSMQLCVYEKIGCSVPDNDIFKGIFKNPFAFHLEVYSNPVTLQIQMHNVWVGASCNLMYMSALFDFCACMF